MLPVHTSQFPPQDVLWRNTTATSLHDFARSPLVCAVRPLPKVRTGHELAPSCKIGPGVCGSAPDADTHPTPVCICSQSRPRCVQRHPHAFHTQAPGMATGAISHGCTRGAGARRGLDRKSNGARAHRQSRPSPSPAAPSESGVRSPRKGRTGHSRACSERPRSSAVRFRDAPRASTG